MGSRKYKTDIVRKCEYCGQEFFVRKAYIDRGDACRFCSVRCMRSYYRERPIRYIDSSGYVVIKVDGRRIREHRAIIEKKIGRKLLRSEHVHHKNGIKDDNRICNLLVMSSGDHHREHVKDYREKNSRVIKCNSCGREKLIMPGYVNHRHGGDWNKIERDYLCRNCYYSSKRWIKNGQ